MATPLVKLSTASIQALSAALRNGRISSPFCPILLREYTHGTDSSVIVDELQRLAKSGLQAAHIAEVLEAIAQERAEHLPVEKLVELVWTGPESDQSSTRDTGAVVREMFANACEDVLVAGYAVYQGKRIFKDLADRMDHLPQLRTRMFLNITRNYQDQRTETELLKSFAKSFRENDWPGQRQPELFYDPRGLSDDSGSRSSLHAKCVVVDSSYAFVTSANFTEAAQDRNIEVGVLVRVASFAKSLIQQFDNMVACGQVRHVPQI
jgi:hypothetical protein